VPGTVDITRKVHMRKHGLEMGKTYVQQNTLIEPNNLVPTWEDGGEERMEVSNTLLNLRKDFDLIAKDCKIMARQKDLLIKNIGAAGEELKRVTKQFSGGNEEQDKQKEELAYIRKCHDVQKMENHSYRSMLDRMKRDLISLTLTINDLSDSLRSKKQISDEEYAKHMKSLEQKLQSRAILHQLTKDLKRDQEKRQERIQALYLSIRNKEEAIQKRTDRKMRQNKIREEAQNESKDQNEIRMRENWLV